MEDNTSSDDEELNNVRKQFEDPNDPKPKKRKLHPGAVHSMMPEHDMNKLPGLENAQTLRGMDVDNIFTMAKKYRENAHFLWLELVGPTCHSVKQTKSGVDLTHVKKKYRNMRCTTCAQYNPTTPWAVLWPRKFELQTLVDHSKSSAHTKAESALIHSVPQDSYQGMLPGQIHGGSLDHELNKPPEVSIMDFPTDQKDPNSIHQQHQQQQQQVRVRTHGGVIGTNASGGMMVAPPPIIAHSTRIRPDWLYSEGALCYSEKQSGDPNLNPAQTKRKYKMLMCLYCRDFVPDSPWAVLRPRKYESAVIGDHERSACHIKAMELRANSNYNPIGVIGVEN